MVSSAALPTLSVQPLRRSDHDRDFGEKCSGEICNGMKGPISEIKFAASMSGNVGYREGATDLAEHAPLIGRGEPSFCDLHHCFANW